MRFDVEAVSAKGLQGSVAAARAPGGILDAAAYMTGCNFAVADARATAVTRVAAPVGLLGALHYLSSPIR